jgi:hypothetical protein
MPFIPTLLKLELMIYYYAFHVFFVYTLKQGMIYCVSTFWMDMDQCFPPYVSFVTNCSVTWHVAVNVG